MKLNTRVKRIICCALAVVLLMGTGAVSQAEKSTFTMKLTRSGRNNDPISKRTIKSGEPRYENKFYMALTSYKGKGHIYFRSKMLKNKAIKSYNIVLSNKSKLNKTEWALYLQEAHEYEYYFLEGVYGAGSASATLNVTGRYTP